jgi:hypothetical protein
MLKNKFHVRIDGISHDQMSQVERRTKEEIAAGIPPKPIWAIMQILVNIAIDNAKDMLLYAINANYTTANALTAAVTIGIPFEKAVLLINQPAVRLFDLFEYRGNLSKTSGQVVTDVKNILRLLKTDLDVKGDELLTKLNNQSIEELDDTNDNENDEENTSMSFDTLNEIGDETDESYIDKSKLTIGTSSSFELTTKQMKDSLDSKTNNNKSAVIMNLIKMQNQAKQGKISKELFLNELKKVQSDPNILTILYQTKVQLEVARTFRKLAAIGEGLKQTSTILTPLRDYTTRLDEQLDLRETVTKIFPKYRASSYDGKNFFTFRDKMMTKRESTNSNDQDQTADDYPFDIPNFFSINPHVKSSLLSLFKVNDIIEDKLTLHSPALDYNLKKIFKMYLDGVKFQSLGFSGPNTTYIEFKRRLAASLYTKVLYTSLLAKGIIKEAKDFKTIDENYNVKFLSGHEAFRQSLVLKLEAVILAEKERVGAAIDKQYSDKIDEQQRAAYIKESMNPFIRKLYIKTNGDITISNAANLDTYELIQMRKSFLSLNDFMISEIKDSEGFISYKADYMPGITNSLKSEMYLYEAMFNGLNYSKSNSLMFIDLDTIKEADDAYAQELKRFEIPFMLSEGPIQDKEVDEIMNHVDNIMRKNAYNLRELYAQKKDSPGTKGYLKENVRKIKLRVSNNVYTIRTGLRQLKLPFAHKINDTTTLVYHPDMIYIPDINTITKELYVPAHYVRDSQGNAYVKVKYIQDRGVYLYKSLGKSSAYVPVSRKYNRSETILDIAKASIQYERIVDVKYMPGTDNIVSGAIVTQLKVSETIKSGEYVKLYNNSDLAMQGSDFK